MTAEEVREAMGSDMSAIADALRETFGPATKITWLKAGDLLLGNPPGGEPIGERSMTIEQRKRGQL